MKSLQRNRAIQGSDQKLIQQNIQDFGSNQARLAMLNGNNEIVHTVVSGDSYSSIAKKYDVPIENVQSANEWKEIIYPGDVIIFSTTGVVSQREEQTHS